MKKFVIAFEVCSSMCPVCYRLRGVESKRGAAPALEKLASEERPRGALLRLPLKLEDCVCSLKTWVSTS